MIRRTAQPRSAEPAEQPPHDFCDTVASADAGLDFQATVRVHWRFLPGEPRPPSPEDLAGYTVQRYLAVAGRYSVLRPNAARQAVRATFANELPVRSYGIEVVHAAVALHVDDDTNAAAQRLNTARRELELDAVARSQVKARLEFLKSVCLADPGTAKLFTLIDTSPRVGAPPDAATLEEIFRTVSTWQSESRWTAVARILDQFIVDLNQPERMELLHILRSAIRTLGRNNHADQISEFLPAAETPPRTTNDTTTQSG
jgi:hypothetical protein